MSRLARWLGRWDGQIRCCIVGCPAPARVWLERGNTFGLMAVCEDCSDELSSTRPDLYRPLTPD